MHIEGMTVKLNIFLTSALGGGELSESCTNHFTPKENSPVLMSGKTLQLI